MTPEIQWTPGVPALAKGKATKFIVCCEHGGKRTVTTATYMQEFWMEWAADAGVEDEEIDAEGGSLFTGWMRDESDSNGDLSSHPLEVAVIAFIPLPLPMGEDNSVLWIQQK